MPSVNSRGVSIRYEVVGSGPPIVLHHGVLFSGKQWVADGFVDDLKGRFSLVLIDARGHGESEKPHGDEHYTGSALANDVIAVIDDLGLISVVFWGYSLGARVGYELADIAPDRVSAFVLGGGSPYAADMRLKIQPGESVRSAILRFFGMTVETIPPAFQDAILSNDFNAIKGFFRSRPSIESAFPKMTVPCLLYVGTEDLRLEQSRSAAKEIGAKLVELPSLDHGHAMILKDLILPHVLPFLESLAHSN